jgi:hypothetical protein
MSRLIDDFRVGGRIGMPWFIAPGLAGDWERHTQRVCAMLEDQSK